MSTNNHVDVTEQSLVYRLRKRAEIRRQVATRKSVQENQPDRLADLLEEAAIAVEKVQAANNAHAKYEEDQLIYRAWRDSEAYQVPVTEEGEKLAEARHHAFKRGWEYGKFYAKHDNIFMKSYLELHDDEGSL